MPSPCGGGWEVEVAGLAPAGAVAGQPHPCTVHPHSQAGALVAPVCIFHVPLIWRIGLSGSVISGGSGGPSSNGGTKSARILGPAK